jgi:sigma-B regulation protein RsbU (phosphoserine phosphatase)
MLNTTAIAADGPGVSMLTSLPARLARRLFRRPLRKKPPLADPLHSNVPALRGAEIAAIYHGYRVAGDFYEFQRVNCARVLFGLFDIAGRREDTRDILIAAQRTFRTLGPKLFSAAEVNEPVAMMELSQQINRTILRQAGVRSCPAFIGCYNEVVGTVCYANAGHTPALVRDQNSTTQLEATGLPLGLFSHTTRSASTCALAPGAALLLVSRGIVEAEHNGEEFGLGGVGQSLLSAAITSARDLCLSILHDTQQFVQSAPPQNDVTALALVRTSTAQKHPR